MTRVPRETIDPRLAFSVEVLPYNDLSHPSPEAGAGAVSNEVIGLPDDGEFGAGFFRMRLKELYGKTKCAE